MTFSCKFKHRRLSTPFAHVNLQFFGAVDRSNHPVTGLEQRVELFHWNAGVRRATLKSKQN